jgi:dinuclear metal center YbgI/SA1388 family protein
LCCLKWAGGFDCGMADLKEVIEFLEKELRTSEIPDYPGAHNGLQLQNGGEVKKVACAVDASLPVIRDAVAQGADLLLVHHGLFWQGVRPLTGAGYDKFKLAIDAGLAIYSSHIPLDIHPEYGNNVCLCREVGLGDGEVFFDWKGIQLGRRGLFDGTLGALRDLVSQAVMGPVMLRGDEASLAGKVGVITGGAGSEVEAMAREGVDTFVTGEGPHWSFSLAEELELNVLYAGHYATETFGVRVLGELLAERFGLENYFVDHPTGL